MLEELRLARRGEHAANLGAFLAHEIAQKAGVQAYVVDPVSVDEWPELARLSGIGVAGAAMSVACLELEGSGQALCPRTPPTVRIVASHRGAPGQWDLAFSA